MARLYANENYSLPAVVELRHLGHDVLTIQETGKGNLSVLDDEVLAFAVAEQRAVLTFNRKHFIRLHNQNASHHGIVICTFDPDFVGLATRVHAAVSTLESLSGKIIRIY